MLLFSYYTNSSAIYASQHLNLLFCNNLLQTLFYFPYKVKIPLSTITSILPLLHLPEIKDLYVLMYMWWFDPPFTIFPNASLLVIWSFYSVIHQSELIKWSADSNLLCKYLEASICSDAKYQTYSIAKEDWKGSEIIFRKY